MIRCANRFRSVARINGIGRQVWFEQHRDATWQAQFLRWLRPQDRLALVHVDALAMDLVGQVQGGDPSPGDQLDLRVSTVDSDRGELQLQLS